MLFYMDIVKVDIISFYKKKKGDIISDINGDYFSLVLKFILDLKDK